MNQIKYLNNAYAKSGTAFSDTTLEAVLKHCETLPKYGKKNDFGSIFIYDSVQLGVHPEYETSTGLILIDIDYIDKLTAETIYNNFGILFNIWPSLLAIQYSSSYYINPKKNGLHIYVKSRKIDKEEYHKQSQICLAIFAQLVDKILHIDLQSMGSEEKPVLDFHNTNIYQRFNLFYSTFKYNNDAIEFDLNVVKFDDLEQLIIKYNLKLDNEIKKAISPTVNNVSIGTGNRLKIDRYLHIGNYKGNDIRFRISIIADKLFGDNAKSFCDRFFYYDNNKSIYVHYPAGNTINPLIYKWLIKNNYIIEKEQNKIENWLDEYSQSIIHEISHNRRLEIVAPTGTGKTTFINNYLAHHFNSVVIVPFNVTNKLYNHLFEVNSTYAGAIPTNKPIVMVWDQAIKHWQEIKDRHFIIDEAHTLFFDRTYRDAAIKLILKLKEDDAWTTFITATPAGESDIFEMKQIHYYKDRSIVRLNIKATKSIEWSQYNYIKKCLDNNWYDKIVLLDDISAKKLYEQFVINGYATDICYIRSSTKESKDFIDLRTNELLKKRLTICTCVAFNGLNFRNEGENILVIGSIQQGETTSCEIIQQIGRIRNSNVTGIYLYDPEKMIINDIDARKEKAQEFNQLMINGVPDTFLSYDRRYLNENYINALKEIQEYQINHSNLSTIIAELGATGYITGKFEDECTDKEMIKMTLAIKRQESDEMKDDIINNRFLAKEYESEYQQKWARDINYMISNNFYSGITIDTFIDLFSKGTKNKLVETVIGTLKDIIRYVQVDEQEFNKTIKNISLYASMLTSPIDKKKFISNMKHIRQLREKYIDKIKFNNGTLDLFEVVADVIAMEAENQLKEKKRMKKIKDLETGKIYDSANDCAKDIGKSKAYISKYKNRFIKI